MDRPDSPWDLPDDPCASCGATSWAEGTAEQFAAMTSGMSESVADGVSDRYRMVVCRECAAFGVVHNSTFDRFWKDAV